MKHVEERPSEMFRGRYGSKNDLAHEAGFDSLVTAQLYAYLRAISPAQVREAANRLFLYKSPSFWSSFEAF